MRRNILHPDRLYAITAKFSQLRIAVVGDFFLDKYLQVDPHLAEPSLETGKVAHQVVSVRCSPGAAGTVVANLASLGAGQLHAVGFCGDDGEGYDLRQGLMRLNCQLSGLCIDPEVRTPTYLKPFDQGTVGLAAEHSRYDTKNRRPTPEFLSDITMSFLDKIVDEVDGIIILDQVTEIGCGVITEPVRGYLANLALRHPGIVFWADSRSQIRSFRHVIVKANESEVVGKASSAAHPQGFRREVLSLRNETAAPVFVTRGSHGIVVTDPCWAEIPAVPVRGEIDPTGAGDSVSAGAVLALCAGATPIEAALIGNLVASVTVQQLGCTGTATCDQLSSQLEVWQQRDGAGNFCSRDHE